MRARSLSSLSLLVFTIFASVFADNNYDGYQILSFIIPNERSQAMVSKLLDRPEFDAWTMPAVGGKIDVMSSPQSLSELHDSLKLENITWHVLKEDVGQYLKEERQEREMLIASLGELEGNVTFNRFMTYDEILEYLDQVVAMYPDIASLETIGFSTEGRTLMVLKLSTGVKESAMFFDSGIHACEWAGPPVAMYAIQQLTENLEENSHLLDNHDFYFLVVANPDGYVYAHEKFRFWRKTRSLNTLEICIGTDPNRNWDWHWAEDEPRGECSVQYPGVKAFSEPEVKAMSDFLTRNTKITAVISIHSFGSYFLHPWGDTMNLPPTSKELARVGSLAADALKSVAGTEYTVGSISNLLYVAYGGTSDWVYGALGIQLSFTIELPGGGVLGFDLPPARILPVATETWEAIKVFADNVPKSRSSATHLIASALLILSALAIVRA